MAAAARWQADKGALKCIACMCRWRRAMRASHLYTLSGWHPCMRWLHLWPSSLAMSTSRGGRRAAGGRRRHTGDYYVNAGPRRQRRGADVGGHCSPPRWNLADPSIPPWVSSHDGPRLIAAGSIAATRKNRSVGARPLYSRSRHESLRTESAAIIFYISRNTRARTSVGTY